MSLILVVAYQRFDSQNSHYRTVRTVIMKRLAVYLVLENTCCVSQSVWK